MNQQWLDEHWLFLVLFAAFLGPFVGYLVKKGLDKAVNLDQDYVTRRDFDDFVKQCTSSRQLCINNQDKCSDRIERVLTSIQKEIRANRMAIFWLADHMGDGVKKEQLFELRKIIEGFTGDE